MMGNCCSQFCERNDTEEHRKARESDGVDVVLMGELMGMTYYNTSLCFKISYTLVTLQLVKPVRAYND